ncbi:MAG: response regulator transcription factor [Verrucomicrobiae bacterium]|nr:response regulator transcription factor [Verrucomicrobiae bacterium]
MTRIVLADDHEVVRRGVRSLLESKPGWEVCGEASNGREAVELVRRLKPDVVVVDLSMPELNGLEAVRQMCRLQPRPAVVVFSMHDAEQLVRDVLQAGALGYVLKSEAAQHLVAAVESVRAGKPYFAGPVARTVLDGFLKAERSAETLTTREREIIQLVAEGQSNKDIARRLGISVKTVETHRAALMRKLGLRDVTDVVRYAVRNRIIEP